MWAKITAAAVRAGNFRFKSAAVSPLALQTGHQFACHLSLQVFGVATDDAIPRESDNIPGKRLVAAPEPVFEKLELTDEQQALLDEFLKEQKQ